MPMKHVIFEKLDSLIDPKRYQASEPLTGMYGADLLEHKGHANNGDPRPGQCRTSTHAET